MQVLYCKAKNFSKLILACMFICFSVTELIAYDRIGSFAELEKYDNITIEYYQVNGLTKQEVRQSIDNLGPADDAGRRWDAFTRWKLTWRWYKNKKGEYDFGNTKVDYNVVLILPEWKNKSNANINLQQEWNSYLEKLVEHELGHIQNVVKAKAELKQSLSKAQNSNPELTASQAQQIAKKVLAKARANDIRYDRETEHGKLQGVNFF